MKSRFQTFFVTFEKNDNDKEIDIIDGPFYQYSIALQYIRDNCDGVYPDHHYVVRESSTKIDFVR